MLSISALISTDQQNSTTAPISTDAKAAALLVYSHCNVYSQLAPYGTLCAGSVQFDAAAIIVYSQCVIYGTLLFYGA